MLELFWIFENSVVLKRKVFKKSHFMGYLPIRANFKGIFGQQDVTMLASLT
ncbi:hypothetical protein NitYY0826_C0520 [Nitratiruptor sp. YY08-26]|nr:hypothetical protein NitYY0813_C0518 [Nitratiruptor sp. YY08-13]BCD65594.1 hypothetical protein NitYY0826_C0520 [Nitratiruptor sp. YY08-26]